MPREGALDGGRPAWLGLSRTHRSSMSTGSNGFQYQVTTSVWFTWSRSSAATRNSMKLGTLGTPPTSSGVELLALSHSGTSRLSSWFSSGYPAPEACPDRGRGLALGCPGGCAGAGLLTLSGR